MSELQDSLNQYASEIAGAVGTINTEITAVEQQLAAGATPDLTSLKAAVDSLGGAADRITAVATGQPDPATPPPAGSSTADAGQPAQPETTAPPTPVAPA